MATNRNDKPAKTGARAAKAPARPARPAARATAKRDESRPPAKSAGKPLRVKTGKPSSPGKVGSKPAPTRAGGKRPAAKTAGKAAPPQGRPKKAGAAKPRPAARSAKSVASEAPTQVRHVRVGPNDAGQRIDNFLIKHLSGVPKSHVYRLLRSGQVRVAGGRAKAERKLIESEEVRIPPVRVAEKGEPVRAPDAVLNRLREAIVFEDDHYLAICKPAGLASHGGTGIAYGVIEAARGWGRHEFLELAHRLDRDTSGVLLLAKSRPALLRAQRAFRDGLADKRYFALLIGRLQGGARDVDAALVKRNIPGGERFIDIDEEDGKPSHSRFVPQAHYRDATLCEVHIHSGRTHQIRVHALALGHSVAGDRKYGQRDEQKPLRDKGLRRMFLHSHYLGLPADGEFGKLLLNAPMTDELREFLDALGPGR